MPTGLKFNYRINWGDGSSIQRVTASTDQTHTYVSPGTYRIKITGICENLNFSGNTALRRIHSSDGLGFKGDIGLRSLNFNSCTNLYGEFPTGLKNLQHLESFYIGFFNSPNIGKNAIGGVVTYSIPPNLFERCARLKDIAGVFTATSITSIPSGLFDPLVNLIDARATFQGCTGLTSIPGNLFRYNTNVAYYANCFKGCVGLTGAIPVDLFGVIGDGTISTAVSFGIDTDTTSGMFNGCTGLYGQIPGTLFQRFTNVQTYSVLFNGCTSLGRLTLGGTPTYGIPSTLFSSSNTASTGTKYGFYGTFQGCTGLYGSIPANLFDTCTNAISFVSVFQGCTGLTSIPSNLFYYNSNVTTYSNTFKNCKNLVLPAQLFNPVNISKVTHWTGFMEVASTADRFTGTMQDVWTGHTMPQADHGNAFRNQTALTNYASIPADWK
jgi:hypothetical protein